MTELEFWTCVIKLPNGCWEWTKCRDKIKGYGELTHKGEWHNAHRLAYKLFHKVNLKTEDFICHTCDNPPCINPDHLYLGTHLTNMKDKARRGRSYIPIDIDGENNTCCRTTKEQVKEIRALFPLISVRSLSILFNLSERHTRKIIKRQKWGCEPNPTEEETLKIRTSYAEQYT